MLPLHPLIVHFPIVITFLLPILILVIAYMIKVNKMSPQGWLIIIGLQLTATVMGYVSLETGETEEHSVQKVLDKKIIHAHEEAAEMFVGVTVIALALSIAAYFLRKDIQFFLQIFIAAVTIGGCYLGYEAGRLGGELIFKHGAASAYSQNHEEDVPQGILPTPGLNTSESPHPEQGISDENESLKTDDNDYGNSDEADEGDDDDAKVED